MNQVALFLFFCLFIFYVQTTIGMEQLTRRMTLKSQTLQSLSKELSESFDNPTQYITNTAKKKTNSFLALEHAGLSCPFFETLEQTINTMAKQRSFKKSINIYSSALEIKDQILQKLIAYKKKHNVFFDDVTTKVLMGNLDEKQEATTDSNDLDMMICVLRKKHSIVSNGLVVITKHSKSGKLETFFLKTPEMYNFSSPEVLDLKQKEEKDFQDRFLKMTIISSIFKIEKQLPLSLLEISNHIDDEGIEEQLISSGSFEKIEIEDEDDILEIPKQST